MLRPQRHQADVDVVLTPSGDQWNRSTGTCTFRQFHPQHGGFSRFSAVNSLHEKSQHALHHT